MPLHVQIESDDRQTTFNIHGFNPSRNVVQKSRVAPGFDYVVLSHNEATNTPTLRLFMTRSEVLSLYKNLETLIDELNAPEPPPIIDPPEAF